MNTITYGDVVPEKKLTEVLNYLLEKTNITAHGLAKALNCPAPTINRLVKGVVTDPRASTLIAISNYFNISIDQLLGNAPLPSTLENVGLAGNISSDNEKYANLSIPIISEIQAVNYKAHVKRADEIFRWSVKGRDEEIGYSDAFAVRLKNHLYEPDFNKGTLLITCPLITPENGDYILVNFMGDKAVNLKKYYQEGSYKYLYPIARASEVRRFDENECFIVGVILEAYMNFKD